MSLITALLQTLALAGGARFALGTIVATPGAIELMERYPAGVTRALTMHARAEWGDVDPEDWAANDAALEHHMRLLSNFVLAYGDEQRRTDHTRLWIITEADRSSTTLLLPEEY